MKHPQHDLLIAAAEDEDARFECDVIPFVGRIHEIETVLAFQERNWRLVKKPVITVEYFERQAHGYSKTNSDSNWGLKITTTDGKRVAEFRD